ncbi:Xaa-Pro peptidase family protein [Halomonas sp. DP8Y7-3]|uniref:M24 family metallopeptidase n=1 Tax=Halomonas sp. DP8Y7-3 TaxID=2859079 RepID=UPI001C987ECC|nr:Xaa-Pro peptidase family protein [Halomonas sp. DP8Y7-3]MBY5927924.1 Xaa-Pro peptidase family protein [Halomonas sp. DP8Y7-3]
MDHLAYRHALTGRLAGAELPFAAEEFDRRLARTRDAMQRQGLDALLLCQPSDIFYLCGYHTFEVSVHAALVVTTRRTLLQVASIETGPAVVTARVDEIVGYRWEAPEEIIDPLAQVLSECRAIGVDGNSPGLRHSVMQHLQGRLGGDRFQHAAGPLMAALRLVKSDAEIDCLARSAAMTAEGLERAIEAVEPGVSDNHIAAAGAQAMLEAGSEFFSLAPIVTTGPRSGTIHVNHQRHPVHQGDVVFLEFGAVWRRYTAPIMRTVVIGSVTDEMQHAAELCAVMESELCKAMVPGRRFEEAANVADQLLAPQRDSFFHSGVYGYSVGAQFPPSWVEGTGYLAPGQTTRFERNMVFHLPLCLRVPGQFGIGLSNTVRVTERGAVRLTNHDMTLVQR